MNKLSVVIVTWNNAKDIKACLDSLADQSYKDFNTIVVDNNSSDGTVEIIEKDFSDIKLIKLSKNIFLTGGNNKGIEFAIENYNPEFVMVLNPDTKLEKETIAKLLETILADSKIGAVGPKVKFFNNENEGKVNSAGLIYDGFMQAYDRGFMEEDKKQFDSKEQVFGVSGVCIIYRVAMLKEIGVYWGKIKLYLDEVELFIRARKKSWKVMFDGSATIYHSYMQSSSENKNLNVEKQKKKAWLWIALRHYSLKSKLAMVIKYLLYLLAAEKVQ